MHYVVIDNLGRDSTVLPVNTDREIAQARGILRETGLEHAVIYAGDPDSTDAVASSLLFAS